VGGYTYTNGKCDQLGYGRININTAVSQALSGTGITISGSTIVCSSGTTFTVNNVPPGYSVYWDKSSNITLPTDRTTNPIVATTNGSGTVGYRLLLIRPHMVLLLYHNIQLL